MPLVFAIGIDALLGFFLAYGKAQTFAEWAPGELHYALSWWGGITAAEFARKEGWGGIRTHFALSLGSWLAILPLELAEGRFSVFTPVVSFVTIEVLSRGGYIVFLGTAAATAVGSEFASEALRWESYLWNQGVGALAEGISQIGGLRWF
jgi:hypothetical protein